MLFAQQQGTVFEQRQYVAIDCAGNGRLGHIPGLLLPGLLSPGRAKGSVVFLIF
jgi:hypothetical protein